MGTYTASWYISAIMLWQDVLRLVSMLSSERICVLQASMKAFAVKSCGFRSPVSHSWRAAQNQDDSEYNQKIHDKQTEKPTAVDTKATIAFGTSQMTSPLAPSRDGNRAWCCTTKGVFPEKKRSRMTEMMIELRYGRLRFGEPMRTLFYKQIISKLGFGCLWLTHIRVIQTPRENIVEISSQLQHEV